MPYQILYSQHDKYFNCVSVVMNRAVTACPSSSFKKYGSVITVGDIIHQTWTSGHRGEVREVHADFQLPNIKSFTY
jgi:hypothetical protein